MAGHIVALGGGGFLMEPENPLLDDYILSLSRRKPARICFLPTASGDSATAIAKFYRAFSGRAVPTDLTLFDSTALPRRPATTQELPAFVESQDIFYVGGGNTANLLALWRAHGLDRLLRRAWRAGAVLSGVSAGMLCWFEGGITDSFGGYKPLHDGLRLLRGTACPHYDGEPQRQAAFKRLVASGAPAGYAVEDGVALHFVGSPLKQVVSSRPKALAYKVHVKRGQVEREQMPVRYLGKPVNSDET